MPSSRGRNSPKGKGGGGGRAIPATGNGGDEGISAIESPVVVATFIASVRKELADRQQFIMDSVQMP